MEITFLVASINTSFREHMYLFFNKYVITPPENWCVIRIPIFSNFNINKYIQQSGYSINMISKIKHLGYVPKISLEEGVKRNI